MRCRVVLLAVNIKEMKKVLRNSAHPSLGSSYANRCVLTERINYEIMSSVAVQRIEEGEEIKGCRVLVEKL